MLRDGEKVANYRLRPLRLLYYLQRHRQKFEQAFIPFHPGAIRYYREIGEWTEAAEATHQANLHRQSILKTAWDVFVPGAPENYVEFEQAWLLARETALAEAGLITLGEGL